MSTNPMAKIKYRFRKIGESVYRVMVGDKAVGSVYYDAGNWREGESGLPFVTRRGAAEWLATERKELHNDA